MIIKTFLTIIFLALITIDYALARVTDGKTHIKTEEGMIKIKTDPGFHLNAEAPATVKFDQQSTTYKPVVKTEKEFKFQIQPNIKEADINFYVCDDKKTACDQHQEKIKLSQASAQINHTEQVIQASANKKNQSVEIKNKTEPTKVDLVSKNGKSTLLVFSAPWCPACIRMQTETYTYGEVAQQLKKINFVKLNSDLSENYELSQKFHVMAIPTLILLNANGEEVFRWLDYQPAKQFAQSLKRAIQQNGDLSKNKLEQQASLADPEAVSQMGMMAYNALDYQQAIKWLSLSKKAEDLKYKLAAEVGFNQDLSEKDEKKVGEYFSALQKGIFLTTSEMDKLRWTVDYIEKKKETESLSIDLKNKAQQIMSELDLRLKNKKALAEDFKQSTFGEATGFEQAEVYLMKSRLFLALEKKQEKEESDKKIIENVKGKQLSISRPGEMLIAISYLREAGETKTVDKMYNELIKKYPKTYVYYEKYSRYLLKQKDLEKAKQNVGQALQFSEGNEPQLYLLKVRILKEMKQKDLAMQTLDDALKIKNIQHAKFKNTFAQLNKIKDELTKEK